MGHYYTRFTPTLIPHLHLLPKGKFLPSLYWNKSDSANF